MIKSMHLNYTRRLYNIIKCYNYKKNEINIELMNWLFTKNDVAFPLELTTMNIGSRMRLIRFMLLVMLTAWVLFIHMINIFQVPPHIVAGDAIVVNTEEDSYIERFVGLL